MTTASVPAEIGQVRVDEDDDGEDFYLVTAVEERHVWVQTLHPVKRTAHGKPRRALRHQVEAYWRVEE